MSQTEANNIYGKIVFQDDNFVVRVKVVEKGLRVVTHYVVDGKELAPKEYMLGENALIMKGK